MKPQNTQNRQKNIPDSDFSASSACSEVLHYFDQISEAPDSIQRLRRFILDLAVRGKLVEQDPNDEPAAELLKRIEVEKARQAGEKTKIHCLPPIKNADIAIPLPDSWEWARLGDLFDYDAGTKIEPNQLPKGAWLLELVDVEKDSGKIIQHFTVDERSPKSTKSGFLPGDVLYGKLRPYLNKVVVADSPGFSTTEIVALRCYGESSPSYTSLALRRPDFVDYVTRLGQGTKMPRLRTEDAVSAPFPLPPLAEQHRIVAKVDELMKLCDELEAAQQKRERRRDRLVTASLAKLTDETDNKTILKFSVSSACSAVSRLEHIQQLRQTILNLAVRGKLVPENPKDEPALQLIKRIEEEKARLISAGNQRIQKSQPLNEDQIPFDIPGTWIWSQLSQIGIINPRNDADDFMEASFIPMPLIYADYKKANQHEVRSWGEIKTGFTHFAEGDIGLAKITPCFENGKSTVFRNLTGQIGAGTTELHIVRPILVVANYILIFLKSPHFIETGIPKMTGTAGQKRVPKDYFAFSPFPLPPLAEQHLIVAKVNELMTLCDELEAQLKKTATTCRQLLETTIHDALSNR
jgi:type I restriction enzyme, S subunit